MTGVRRLRRPSLPHPLSKTHRQLAWDRMLWPSAGPAVVQGEVTPPPHWLRSGLEPTRKSFLRDKSNLSGVMPSSPGLTTPTRFTPARAHGLTPCLHIQQRQIGIPSYRLAKGLSCLAPARPRPTPRSTWPQRRDPPAATACNGPASSGSTTSQRSSGRATLPPTRPGPEPYRPGRCARRTRRPGPPP